MRCPAVRLLLLASIAGCGTTAEVQPTAQPAAAQAPVVAADAAPETPAVVPAPAVAPTVGRRAETIPLALDWLKEHQAADGSWDGDVGTTGLALLAFLGAGETHKHGQFRENVNSGLTFLRERQDADGCFGPRTAPRFLGDHALAALAMCEAYGLTGSRLFAGPTQQGVAFALSKRTPGGGWRRAAENGGELDVGTTGWMAALLWSAVQCELGAIGVNEAALAESVADLGRLTDPATGRVGGAEGGAATAIVLFARIFAGHTPKNDDLLRTMADAVIAEPAACGTAMDVERTYFGTMGVRRFGGDRWRRWNGPMSATLVGGQRREPGDPERGSWDAAGSGTVAGRVRTTALCCMTLEVYYGGGGRRGWDEEKSND